MKAINFLFLSVIFFSSCKTDIPEVSFDTGYPDNVKNIIVNKCATSGCHNAVSRGAAAGLDLSTWDSMLSGTNTGAAVIPFRNDYSTLLYFTCPDNSLGDIISTPTMPLNADPLSDAEYLLLKNWIINGAPDNNGNIMFADNPTRHKYYITNQGCDKVTVMDADRKVAMRIIDVGIDPSYIESPHNVRVSPDGRFWMLTFLNADVIQIFDAVNDHWIKNIPIGNGFHGQWNVGLISADSKKAYISDFSSGYVCFVDIESGTSTTDTGYPITGGTPQLHGLALNKNNDTLYITCQNDSRILKIPVNDRAQYSDVKLYNSQFPTTLAMLPHDVVFTPDFQHYLVSCQGPSANNVVVMNTSTDEIVTQISVGNTPQELAVSSSHNLAFVSNMEDSSISVIDLNNFTERKRISVGSKPHAVAVDEKKQLVYVANRNATGHHSSVCGGFGSLSVIDLNTLNIVSGYKAELFGDPYSIAVRP